MPVRVRALLAEDVSRIATIDRAEHVDVAYEVVEGRLTTRPVPMSEIPAWDPAGSGPHSVAHQIDFCTSAIASGGVLLGAFPDDDEDEVAGLAVVDPAFERGLAWLAFLHVSRPHRRRGAASALWGVAEERARAAGAASMYVSATPTGSAVGFYMRQGCRLADPVHPVLFATEPEDIHLLCPLA